MVWFKVDDKLHSHPKTPNASLAAIGLWTLAGSWCGDHTTDGRIPSNVVASLARGAFELADELVAAGFWVRVRDGYRFHQWLADGDGTKRNPSKKEVEAERKKKAEAGRKGGLASGRARSKRQARASPIVPESLNPRPSPSKEGSGDARAAPLGAPRVPPAVTSPPEAVDLDALRAKLRGASKAHRAKANGQAAGAYERLMATPVTEPTPTSEPT